MKSVTDLAQLDELIIAAKNRCGAINVNSYLMAEAVKRACGEEKLYYDEIDAGLLLYLENQRSFNLSLYINPQIPLQIRPKKKPVVTGFIGVNSLGAKCAQAIHALTETGFVQNSSSIRIIMKLDHSNLATAPDNVGVITAGREHSRQIMALWEATFDPIQSNLPDETELKRQLDDGNILCVLDGGQVVGVLQVEILGRIAWSWHQAVNPPYRGKGVGRALSAEYHRRAAEKDVHTLYGWVNADSAVAFHSHFGFSVDNRFLKQYLLNARKDV